MQATSKEIETLRVVKKGVTEIYYTIGEVFCPILNTKITFNSTGLRHLTIKPDGTIRNVREAIHKMKFFPLVIPTIKNATHITEERSVRVPVGRGKRRKYKNAKTYTLIAHVGKRSPVTVRVILLRIGNGKYVFYSVMKN